MAHWNQVGTPSMTLRTPRQIARFFDGLTCGAGGGPVFTRAARPYPAGQE